MQIKRYILLALPVLLLSSCHRCTEAYEGDPSSRLLLELEQRLNDGIMLGHQDDLAYGCMWYDQPGASDMNGVSGDYPAVFGWDIGNIEVGGTLNPDSVRIEKIRNYIATADSLGSISTVRWSAAPIADEDCLHIASVLPDGENNSRYNLYLDAVAAFLNSLTDAEGHEIAVIFQPLYCPNENGHWWCATDEDIDAYKEAWNYTVNYLRRQAGVDNALFAFSLASPHSAEEWTRYYPGDECVDIVGVDILAEACESIEDFNDDFAASIAALSDFAGEHHKLPAVTATGMVGVKTPGFFTHHMAKALGRYPVSYVMLWKNSWKDEDSYFVPFRGHPVADDFKNFVESDNIITCSDLALLEHTAKNL